MTHENTVSVEARQVPRLDRTLGQGKIADIAWGQVTFWGAIQQFLGRRFAYGTDREINPIVELLFMSEPEDRRTRIIVNIDGISKIQDDAKIVLRALPPGYGWYTRGGELFASNQNMLPKVWQVCRVERRISFVDLPFRLLDSLDGSGTKKVDATLGLFSAEGQQRRLLMRPAVRSEVEFERICLPINGAVILDDRSLRALFEELRSYAPAVVSFTVAPIDETRMDNHRRIAMFWAAHLKLFGYGIANAGYADLDTLSAQYNRFLLPDAFMCVMTVRVAAPAPETARALALRVVARLGGLRSFKIRDPVEALLKDLGDPWNDVPHRAWWSDGRWKSRRERLRQEAAQEAVDTDFEEVFEEFLIELPHLYTIDEASTVAQLPVVDEEGMPGIEARLLPPFAEPSKMYPMPIAHPPPEDRMRIGISNSQSNSVLHGVNGSGDGDWHTIPPRDLTKHAFIVGSTGSGKTVTTLFLIRELARLKQPFLIIEPVKTEYFQQLEQFGIVTKRYCFEGTADGRPSPNFFSFDPMRLQTGVSVARHASYLKSCFEAAFPLDPISALILDAGIRAYYTDKSRRGCHLTLFTRGSPKTHRIELWDVKGKLKRVVHPSFRGFKQFFMEDFLPNKVVPVQDKNQGKLLENQVQWLQWFQRRFDAIDSGLLGLAAYRADVELLRDHTASDSFSKLLEGNVVLELDGVPDDEHKALLIAFMMIFLFERRQADDLIAREKHEIPSDDLRHVLILEEAHRILASSSRTRGGEVAGASAQAKSVSMFIDMLAEIRAFGQSLIIVEQIPTKIVPEVVKNTNLKIMLRLTAADDREFLGSAMNFTDAQKQFVTSLRAEPGRGIDMVVFEQQLDQPRLLTLPLPERDGRPLHADLFLRRIQRQRAQ